MVHCFSKPNLGKQPEKLCLLEYHTLCIVSVKVMDTIPKNLHWRPRFIGLKHIRCVTWFPESFRPQSNTIPWPWMNCSICLMLEHWFWNVVVYLKSNRKSQKSKHVFDGERLLVCKVIYFCKWQWAYQGLADILWTIQSYLDCKKTVKYGANPTNFLPFIVIHLLMWVLFSLSPCEHRGKEKDKNTFN